jgi:hypothetical protein
VRLLGIQGFSVISVLILTKDEQQDLPCWLESARWSDDLCVYDWQHGRDSKTAARTGARFIQRQTGLGRKSTTRK